MAHSFKERNFLVDKAIELGVFKTLQHDVDVSKNNKYLVELVNELKEQNIDPNEAYRVVNITPDGNEQVFYTSREALVELLKSEEGFDHIWQEVKKECEEIIDKEKGESFQGEIEDEYEEEL